MFLQVNDHEILTYKMGLFLFYVFICYLNHQICHTRQRNVMELKEIKDKCNLIVQIQYVVVCEEENVNQIKNTKPLKLLLGLYFRSTIKCCMSYLHLINQRKPTDRYSTAASFCWAIVR